MTEKERLYAAETIEKYISEKRYASAKAILKDFLGFNDYFECFVYTPKNNCFKISNRIEIHGSCFKEEDYEVYLKYKHLIPSFKCFLLKIEHVSNNLHSPVYKINKSITFRSGDTFYLNVADYVHFRENEALFGRLFLTIGKNDKILFKELKNYYNYFKFCLYGQRKYFDFYIDLKNNNISFLSKEAPREAVEELKKIIPNEFKKLKYIKRIK